MVDDTIYYNAFNLIDGIGPVKFKKLAKYFGNLENAWQAGAKELEKSGLDEKVIEKISAFRPKISPEKEWEKLHNEQIKVITVKNKEYPELLKQIYDPPAILYVKGNLAEALKYPLAVVGSRKVSSYGIRAINDIVGSLARSGVNIISGMAFGVDTAAHETAISNGAKTVAVLASGIDAKNISSRKQIAEKIIANGAIISEYPVGKPAKKHQFPLRNRIVAGLAPAVLVIEAAEKSGAMITPRLALENNRDVFAIPGSIYSPGSKGTNNLIKQGAKTITDPQDILEEFGLTKSPECINNKNIIRASGEESDILSALKIEPLHLDEIARITKNSASKISSLLMVMEMKGTVKNLGNGNYAIIA